MFTTTYTFDLPHGLSARVRKRRWKSIHDPELLVSFVTQRQYHGAAPNTKQHRTSTQHSNIIVYGHQMCLNVIIREEHAPECDGGAAKQGLVTQLEPQMILGPLRSWCKFNTHHQMIEFYCQK